MPRTSDWTELLGEAFLEQVDALCEEIKSQLGWPPLGQAELSPSGARYRQKQDVAILAELFERVGPERALRLLQMAGLELLDEFGERVVSEALQRASGAFGGQPAPDVETEDQVEVESGTTE